MFTYVTNTICTIIAIIKSTFDRVFVIQFPQKCFLCSCSRHIFDLSGHKATLENMQMQIISQNRKNTLISYVRYTSVIKCRLVYKITPFCYRLYDVLGPEIKHCDKIVRFCRWIKAFTFLQLSFHSFRLHHPRLLLLWLLQLLLAFGCPISQDELVLYAWKRSLATLRCHTVRTLLAKTKFHLAFYRIAFCGTNNRRRISWIHHIVRKITVFYFCKSQSVLA